MNEKALQSLYDEMSAQYDVGSFEDFKEYLSDDKQRNAFFEEAIKPNYDVASLDEFDNTYGLKKKEDFISEDPKSESELDKDFSGIPIFKFISDAVGRGVAQGNTTDEALGLLMSGNSATEDEINEYIKAVQAMESYAPSEAMNKFQKEYIENGSDVSAFLSALWNNKSVAPEILLQSFAGMATAATTDEGAALATAGLTAGAGAGAFIGGVGAIPGGFIGGMAAANGALETATSLTEFIKDELDERGSEFNSENVRAILQDEDAFSSIKTKALLRGGIISSIDLIGGGVAGKAVKGVSEVSKIGARATKLAQVGTGLAIESTAGGLGEAAAMAATGQEMDAAEIGLEAIGGTVTAPISIGGAMRQSTYKLKKGNESVEYTREQLQKEVEKDPSILAEAELEIKNAPEGEKEKYDAIQKRERIKKDLPSDIPSENVEQIIDKEIEADELKNKKSIAAKKRSKEIISEIEQLMKAEEKKEDVAESVAEKEPFETKRVKITEPFTIGQSEVLFNEDGSVSDVVNKRTGNPVTPSTRSKVEKKILQDVIDVDAGKKAPDQEGLTPDNIASYFAENSENVREIAEAIRIEKKRIKDAEQKADEIKTQDRGKESLAGETFTRESWEDATGNPPSDNISNYWIRSEEKGGKNIKNGAKGFDPDTIVKFILDYPNAEALKVFRGEPLDRNDLIDLENKFQKLTGIKPTESNLQTVVDVEQGRVPVELIEEQAAKQEEFEIEQKVEQAEEQAKAEREAAVEPKTEGITGRILDALKKGKDFLKKQATVHFTAQGLQPDIIYRERQKRDSNIRMYQNRIDRMRKDINSVLKKIPKDQRDSVMKEFDQVFRGNLDPNKSTLSDDMLAIAGRMRAEIDGLSNMIIESGYFDAKEGIEAVEKNIGSYVNRSYRLFSNSNWANKVSEEVKENARRFFRRQAIQEGRTVSEQEIENQINEILNKAEDNKYIVKGKDGRIDKDILRRRKDVPAELRALMGEVTNPLENYQNTVAKQAMLLFNYKFQRKIAESGSNTFFTKSPTKENTVQIVKEGNEAYPELAGLWTTPEIAKTFEMPNPMNSHYDAFVKFSSAIKWGKTVGSIATHAKNIFGNHGFVLMNGHLDWKELTNAADLAFKEFIGKTTEEQRAYLDELISLGIVKQSTTLGDITSMYGDKSFEEAYKRTIIDQARNVASKKEKLSDLFRESKAGKTTKALVDKLNDAYQSEDDFFKIMAYGIEKQRYAKALFGKDKADLTKSESDKVNEVVSEIVKNTYPTYDRVPPIIKRLGRSPILGAFVSFRAESIRTAFNTYKIALNEVKSSNKEIAKIGAKRLASAGIYTGLKVTLATQLGLAAQSLMFGGEDDESEEYNDLRKFVASWSQDSLIAITNKEPGKYSFIDLTANDPHSFLSELIIAGRDDNDSTPLFIDKLVALGEPFLGKDLVAAFASEAYLVYNDKKLTTGEKGEKIMGQFFKLIQPGTITTAIRLQKAASGNDNNVFNEGIGAFTGYRPVNVDVEKSYLFRAIDLKDRKASLNGRYNRVRYNEKSTEVELEKAYEEVNRDYSQMIKEAQELTQSAIRLGVDSNNIASILKKNGFNARDIAFIFSGKEYVYIPTKMRR